MFVSLTRLAVIAVMTLGALCAGCAASGPHRKYSADDCTLTPARNETTGAIQWESKSGQCPDSWKVRVDKSSGFLPHGINYVEFDEQGIAHDRRAIEDALAYAKAPPSEGKAARYVIVFIHGWHHGAAPDDSNIQDFHGALDAFSRWHQDDADVRGIYIGWQGESIDLPAIKYLTFWDRKNTSDEVGRGGLLEFLLRLEATVKTGDRERDRLVLIGHSFGASVTFNSLAHTYVERFLAGLNQRPGDQRFRGYGDLVVLINPAIEAMRFMPFQSMLQYYGTANPSTLQVDYSNETVPRLIVLSSLGDWATRYTFSVARYLNTPLERHRRISANASPDPSGAYVEWNMDNQTLGNFQLFQTHQALRLEDNTMKDSKEDVSLQTGQVRDCRQLASTMIKDLLNGSDGTEKSFPQSRVVMARKAGSVKNSPYLLMDVDKALISDHTEIWNQNLLCWLNQLVDTTDRTRR